VAPIDEIGMRVAGKRQRQVERVVDILNESVRTCCRATSGDGASQCGVIRDANLGAYCMAAAQRQSLHCGFIKNRDKSALCLAKIEN
jgi:hypothetical protein